MKTFWDKSSYICPLQNKDQSIIGTLIPIRWDRNGRAEHFSVYSEDEEDVIIENYKNKKRLKNLLNKRVLAKGKIRIDENGDKFVHLKSIKELADPASPATHLFKPIDRALWSEEHSLCLPFSLYDQTDKLYWEAC